MNSEQKREAMNRLRMKLGVSLDAFAAMGGYTRSKLACYERGEVEWPDSVVLELCRKAFRYEQERMAEVVDLATDAILALK